MKMKKLARVFTSAALVSAMVATMGGMTAFAADCAIPDNQLPLTKVVVADENTYAPDEAFEFVVEPVEEEPGATINSGSGFGGLVDTEGNPIDGNLAVRSGIKGGLVIDGSQVKFAPDNERSTKEGGYVNANANIRIEPSLFSEVGIYHYQVQEKTPNKTGDYNVEGYEGIVYDEVVRDLYVYVTLVDGKVTISNIVVSIDGKKVGIDQTVEEKYKDPDTQEAVATGVVFKNYYGVKGDPEKDTVQDLQVKKIVTGNQGNKTTPFEFKIQVNGKNGTEEESGENYKLVKYNSNGEKVDFPAGDGVENGAVRLSSGASKTVSLASGEYFKVYGLTKSDVYTVTEMAANGDSYTTTYNVDGKDTLEEGNTAYTANITGSVEKVADSVVGGIVNVYNRRNVTTPTGIVLSFAPYILLVALAGVFGVLFLRRKKEEF